MSGCGGSSVTGPSQEPARDFSRVKDFSASDGETLSAALCISDCARATLANHIRTKSNVEHIHFMAFLLQLPASSISSQGLRLPWRESGRIGSPQLYI